MAEDTPLRKQHEQLGAGFGVYFDCALPARYAPLADEYRLAKTAVAVLDASYHAYAELTGSDRVRYLNAVVSNDVKSLGTGEGTQALLLNPQGHILAELEIYALVDRLLISCPASARERAFATLEKFIIMDDAIVEDVTPNMASIALEGPRATGIVRQICGAAVEEMKELTLAEATVRSIPCRVIRHSETGSWAVRFVVPQLHAAELWQILLEAARSAGGGPMGYEALNALRLEAGIPWYGYDFDDKTIPHEAALESTHVSFTKGCYTGQEIVERVRSRGHVNRRRVGLAFSGPEPPSPGEKLLVEGKEVGQVTCATHSPALGRPIGMGYVHREHNAAGSQLTWSGGTAEVIELPLQVRGATTGT